MPKAAQPVNVQSTALGVTIRKVIVEQVVPERGVAIVRDGQQFTTEIPYRVQQGLGRLPQVGEYWYVDRSLGPWIFSAYIAKSDDDVKTLSQGAIVPGDEKIQMGGDTSLYRGSAGTLVADGALVTTGNLATKDTYIDGGVFITGGLSAGGTYVNGNLTVVNDVAAVNVNASGNVAASGNITATGDLVTSGAVLRPRFVASSTSNITPLTSTANTDGAILSVSATFKNNYAYRLWWAFKTQHNGGTSPFVSYARIRRASATGTIIYEAGGVACITTNFMHNTGFCDLKNTSGADHTQTIVLCGGFSASGGATSMDILASSTSPRLLRIEIIGTAAQYGVGALEVPTA